MVYGFYDTKYIEVVSLKQVFGFFYFLSEKLQMGGEIVFLLLGDVLIREGTDELVWTNLTFNRSMWMGKYMKSSWPYKHVLFVIRM